MYEFDKTNFLASCDYYSIAMLYGETNRDRSEARDKLLAFVKDLADSYSTALKSLNAIELTKSGGSESGKTEDKENRSEPKSVCKFTWNTMSDKCRIWLEKGGYYIFINPEVESIKERYEKRKKEMVERCFG